MKIPDPNVKYYPFKGRVFKVTRDAKGIWRDKWGCVYAVNEAANSFDATDRCGIWPLALPKNHIFNEWCKPHDFMYSSTAYRLFNDRIDADRDLRDRFIAHGYPITAWIVYAGVRVLGKLVRPFW